MAKSELLGLEVIRAMSLCPGAAQTRRKDGPRPELGCPRETSASPLLLLMGELLERKNSPARHKQRCPARLVGSTNGFICTSFSFLLSFNPRRRSIGGRKLSDLPQTKGHWAGSHSFCIQCPKWCELPNRHHAPEGSSRLPLETGPSP